MDTISAKTFDKAKLKRLNTGVKKAKEFSLFLIAVILAILMGIGCYRYAVEALVELRG